MTGDTLFAREEQAIAVAEEFLAEADKSDDGATEAVAVLLSEYRRLFKITKRLMRLSDRNERELASMAEARKRVADEIECKNKELEVLSAKLAKYLSPQVYDSIFTGRQEVKLQSVRKKLTIFFSDIEGFTELTDKLESEDLTRLINRYLTEMSKIALEHGATVDKFVGDAIMAFFGDPQSQGVKNDALACVRMALAMQQRIAELDEIWQTEGIERPMACRIGIHTGYCTVGNFGSDDRMDYTILGGAVNLASRLEKEAEAGTVLISYETFAQIKDEIVCEPVGQINIKGIAYPVSVYRVIGFLTELPEVQGPITKQCDNLRLEINLPRMNTKECKEVGRYLRAVADQLDTDLKVRDRVDSSD